MGEPPKTTIQFHKLQKLLPTEKSPLADKLIETIIQPDVVPRSVEFLAMDHRPQLQWKAAWLLAYIASGSFKHTEMIIDHGAAPIFGKPQPPFEQALSFLSYGSNDKIQAVIEAGVCARLVQLLLHPSPSVVIHALRTLGNIATGDDMQTQAVIEAGLIASLVNLFQNAEFHIQTEVAWAFFNASSGDTNEQIKYLVGKVEKSFGNAGDHVNLYARMINDAEGLKKIENMQSHDNNEIYEKAVKILKTYYSLEDEDETLPPGSKQ
ncbi:hypothetical protein TSUD_195020 [Trifolium subterraneum]|nr:hypothetical protein TSUD_195020 [Trifolium subterraneum]